MDASVYAEVDDDLKKSRLPNALSNRVYEIAFLDRMPAVAPDLGAPVCVYGAESGSLESRMAAEKLCRHGYTQVYEFSIDMRAITCLDLAGNPLHDVLVRHLCDHSRHSTSRCHAGQHQSNDHWQSHPQRHFTHAGVPGLRGRHCRWQARRTSDDGLRPHSVECPLRIGKMVPPSRWPPR